MNVCSVLCMVSRCDTVAVGVDAVIAVTAVAAADEHIF